MYVSVMASADYDGLLLFLCRKTRPDPSLTVGFDVDFIRPQLP